MTKNYSRKEIIFQEGDIADCMYEVKSGCVNICANYGQSDAKLLVILTAGMIFGEMGLLEQMPRSATAVVMENDTQAEMITAEGFADYFRSNPEKILTVMKHMSSRIRNLTGDYLNACRAVAEYEEAAATGKKSSWLKEHVKKFLQDYSDASAYMSQHPDIFFGSNGYHDPHML